jgi:hypothetical protein
MLFMCLCSPKWISMSLIQQVLSRMAWKRSSVRSRSGPPISPSLTATCRHRRVPFCLSDGAEGRCSFSTSNRSIHATVHDPLHVHWRRRLIVQQVIWKRSESPLSPRGRRAGYHLSDRWDVGRPSRLTPVVPWPRSEPFEEAGETPYLQEQRSTAPCHDENQPKLPTMDGQPGTLL